MECDSGEMPLRMRVFIVDSGADLRVEGGTSQRQNDARTRWRLARHGAQRFLLGQ